MDLVGGWHDASDLLKWSGPTLVGMFGLLNIAERSGERQLMARVLEEVRWGNLYFLKLQAPEGYFYKHGIGGDAPEEGNHWTDNIRGTADDRRVVVHEADPAHDHGFIAAQAHLARLYRDWDAAYAKVCLEAALKCYRWVSKKESAAYDDYGTGCYAGLMLFHATGEREYLDYAARMADSLVGLQETGGGTDELRGYFYENASRQHGVPYEYNDRHFLTLATIGFCKLIEEAKGTLETARWEQALARHCNEYLHLMSERNAFGIVPYQVKLPETLVPGSRAYRGVSYRYFMSHLNGDWWSGNNTVLAGTGIVLCHAARILGERRHRDLGQRMLDWILGLNPFDVCMMRGVGHKHPPEYVDTGFIPRTPKITGSVMNGICGDGEDRPALQPGSWHSAEIWTPPLAQTIWLASELRYRD
jgi:hypothetical protein